MTNTEPTQAADAGVIPTDAPGARGVRATWAYTLGSSVFMSAIVVFFWGFGLGGVRLPSASVAFAYAAVAVVWFAVWLWVFAGYRHSHAGVAPRPMKWLIPALIVGLAAAVGVAIIAQSALLGCSLVATIICSLPWSRGPRARVTIGLTIVLLVLAWIEVSRLIEGGSDRDIVSAKIALALFAMMLPSTIVVLLWWWDIVRELDLARATEARLAAAQERLRLANDVHDLQGHHLQVIALQLELAERLMEKDPTAARDQLLAAQRSVDEARDGTRALAIQFRGVPLPDELANAADLLRADGHEVELVIDPDAAHAPSDVLGAVIRESTTNILKHGGGARVTLSLTPDGAQWLYSATNDGVGDATVGSGSGLNSMRERLEGVGGSLQTAVQAGTFELHARVGERAS